MMKRTWVSTLALLGLMATGLPAAANTITYSYLSVAGDEGPGAGISYVLEIDDATGDATFTVDGDSSAAEIWTAGWFTFKFDGSNTLDITNFVAPSTGGAWSVADVNENTDVKLLKGGTYNKLLDGGAAGFYVSSLAEGAPPDDTSQGVCLTTAFCTDETPAVFTFTLNLPTNWSIDDIPMQVGFYDGLTGGREPKVVTNQLSKELIPSVPDGGLTIGLLGAALVVVEILRRSNA